MWRSHECPEGECAEARMQRRCECPLDECSSNECLRLMCKHVSYAAGKYPKSLEYIAFQRFVKIIMRIWVSFFS
jgi:hypothetical protein